MMMALATAFRWIGGDGLKVFVVPALLLGLLIAVQKAVEGYGDRIETAAANECNSSWLLTVSKRKERVAAAQLQAAQTRLQGERDLNMGLNNELDQIRAQNAALEQKLREQPVLASDDAERCIPPELWNSLRHDGVGRGSKGTAESRGSGKGNPAKN